MAGIGAVGAGSGTPPGIQRTRAKRPLDHPGPRPGSSPAAIGAADAVKNANALPGAWSGASVRVGGVASRNGTDVRTGPRPAGAAATGAATGALGPLAAAGVPAADPLAGLTDPVDVDLPALPIAAPTGLVVPSRVVGPTPTKRAVRTVDGGGVGVPRPLITDDNLADATPATGVTDCESVAVTVGVAGASVATAAAVASATVLERAVVTGARTLETVPVAAVVTGARTLETVPVAAVVTGARTLETVPVAAVVTGARTLETVPVAAVVTGARTLETVPVAAVVTGARTLETVPVAAVVTGARTLETVPVAAVVTGARTLETVPVAAV